MYMHNYQANLQASTVLAVASALMDRQMRTRMSQGGVTSHTESEFTKKQQKKKQTLQMWKRSDQLGRATRHWSKHECMTNPQHVGRLYGKQVKWWQSGNSS